MNSKGVSYNDIDVSQNKAAADEMVKISGQMSVPVIVINGKAITGFDRDKIEGLIKG